MTFDPELPLHAGANRLCGVGRHVLARIRTGLSMVADAVESGSLSRLAEIRVKDAFSELWAAHTRLAPALEAFALLPYSGACSYWNRKHRQACDQLRHAEEQLDQALLARASGPRVEWTTNGVRYRLIAGPRGRFAALELGRFTATALSTDHPHVKQAVGSYRSEQAMLRRVAQAAFRAWAKALHAERQARIEVRRAERNATRRLVRQHRRAILTRESALHRLLLAFDSATSSVRVH